DHRRRVATIALANEVAFRDAEVLQERDHVFGVLLDRERATRNVGGAAVPLEVDRDDRMALAQGRKRVLPGKAKRWRDEDERLARTLHFVVHFQPVDGRITTALLHVRSVGCGSVIQLGIRRVASTTRLAGSGHAARDRATGMRPTERRARAHKSSRYDGLGPARVRTRSSLVARAGTWAYRRRTSLRASSGLRSSQFARASARADSCSRSPSRTAPRR